MFWRMVAVMRLVRCRLPPVVNRTGVQCRRLGGEHREPKTDEKCGSSSNARVWAHRQAV
jgi:hypothetical protein